MRPLNLPIIQEVSQGNGMERDTDLGHAKVVELDTAIGQDPSDQTDASVDVGTNRRFGMTQILCPARRARVDVSPLPPPRVCVFYFTDRTALSCFCGRAKPIVKALNRFASFASLPER